LYIGQRAVSTRVLHQAGQCTTGPARLPQEPRSVAAPWRIGPNALLVVGLTLSAHDGARRVASTSNLVLMSWSRQGGGLGRGRREDGPRSLADLLVSGPGLRERISAIGDLAASQRSALKSLHADNGNAMRAATLEARLGGAWALLRSSPGRGFQDNPLLGSLFRRSSSVPTTNRGHSLNKTKACEWGIGITWIGTTTGTATAAIPSFRHASPAPLAGRHSICQQRADVYEKGPRRRHPRRWSQSTAVASTEEVWMQQHQEEPERPWRYPSEACLMAAKGEHTFLKSHRRLLSFIAQAHHHLMDRNRLGSSCLRSTSSAAASSCGESERAPERRAPAGQAGCQCCSMS